MNHYKVFLYIIYNYIIYKYLNCIYIYMYVSCVIFKRIKYYIKNNIKQ